MSDIDYRYVAGRVAQAPFAITRIIFLTVIGMIKACLPASFLPQKSVKGDVVLITGSAGGLGRQMAVMFAQKGAQLVLWDLNETANQETKRLVEAEGVKAHCYNIDLSRKEQIYERANEVLADLGRVDVLINNAGIVSGKKLFDCPDELMEKTMSVNTNALFFLAKAFVPGMMDRDHGHVVTIASMAGKVGVAGLVDYCSSKFGAVGFAESLRAELRLRSSNVNVSVICPYYIKTGMFDGVQSSSPLLLPLMETEYAAKRIVDAVLTNAVLLYMPRFCYFVMMLKEILPTAASEAIADFVGVNHEMDTFKGRCAAKTK